MKLIYAHDAVVRLGSADDPAAVGAAVTKALCGDWQHEPPCPLAPHHTRAERHDDEVRVRILFAADPKDEGRVRRLIEQVLAGGHLESGSGHTVAWQLTTSNVGVVHDSELDHGERLLRS